MDLAELREEIQKEACEQATGCGGAGGYLDWAKQHGYTHVGVLDWSSSAGDWQFLVSKNGVEWYIMCQENNYPHPGFSRGIITEGIDGGPFWGTLEEAQKQVYDLLEGW